VRTATRPKRARRSWARLELDALESLSDRAFRRAVLEAAGAARERRRALKREEGRRRRQRHPELFRHYKAMQRARERGAVGYHSLAEWHAKLDEYEHRCAFCGRDGLELCRARLIAPHKGGTNEISNVVPACRSCLPRAWRR
jgi:hypothetical protein